MSMKLGNGLNLQNRPIDNVADPSSAQQAATKNYVDGVIRGLDWKQEVKAASTGNLTLSGTQTVDGIALIAGDRVLVKDQTTQSGNGVYDVASGAWSRSADSTSGTQISGSTYTVQQGTVNADRVYRVLTDDTITVGTTSITFGQVGAGGTTYTGTNGVSVSGANITGVAAASGGLTVSASGFAVDTSIVARKYSIAIGNGSLTSIAVSHNLGTRAVHWSLYDASTFEFILTDAVATDTNTVTFTFATAPATGAYVAVIVG